MKPTSNQSHSSQEAQKQGYAPNSLVDNLEQLGLCSNGESHIPTIIEIVPCLSCGAELYLELGSHRHIHVTQQETLSDSIF